MNITDIVCGESKTFPKPSSKTARLRQLCKFCIQNQNEIAAAEKWRSVQTDESTYHNLECNHVYGGKSYGRAMGVCVCFEHTADHNYEAFYFLFLSLAYKYSLFAFFCVLRYLRLKIKS